MQWLASIGNFLSGFAVVWQDFDYLMLGNYPNGPLAGMALTLMISAIAIVFATLLGIITGIGLTVLRGVAKQCVVIVLGFLRAIPVIMLIFWTYFLLPVLFGVDIPAITTVIFALALIGAAYIAYSVHAGMMAIANEQWQAALSLGLGRWQVIGYIILPQALKMMLPSFVNQWIALIKDSSLAYIVGVAEFTFLATQINNRAMVYPTEIFLFVIVAYFVICLTLDVLVNMINRRWQQTTT